MNTVCSHVWKTRYIELGWHVDGASGLECFKCGATIDQDMVEDLVNSIDLLSFVEITGRLPVTEKD